MSIQIEAPTRDEQALLGEVLQALSALSHGSVQIFVQDSRVVQIDTLEKKRIGRTSRPLDKHMNDETHAQADQSTGGTAASTRLPDRCACPGPRWPGAAKFSISQFTVGGTTP